MVEDKSGTCQAIPLGEAWTLPSRSACFAACMSTYSDNCRSFVYNEVSQACIPGATAFGALQNVEISVSGDNSGGTLFYVKPVNPECNTADGFALYEMCGSAACLYLSDSKADFDGAVQSCTDINSNLIIANTLAKFALFWHVSLNNMNQNTYLWLSDLTTEGQFLWGDGQTIGDQLKDYIWADREPDNWFDEDCAQAKHQRNPKPSYGISDVICVLSEHFICERVA
ncbi:Cd209 antigen [Plakobranchus ocellatus]|uniref:Cd209 antigen n=1 Tax=Plakobranchus ocellatus TaxID=259542 RepID=A0AAV3Z8V2_9GAST|nr:Cd209 antigen [Plakobranchus ocellatus]